MRLVACLVALVATLFAAMAARAEPAPVDLELVLAVDSSSSVDYGEFDLQARGLAAAFRDADVIEAIAGGPIGAVAVTVLEWSSADRGYQVVNIPWRRVTGPDESRALAAELEAMPRLVRTGGTAISQAIRHAVGLFRDNGFDGARQVIDVSGDGRDNWHRPVPRARDYAMANGVTINGLAIQNEEPELAAYYRAQVIGGAGAFVIEAADYADFARAIREKLLREIRSIPIAAAGGYTAPRKPSTKLDRLPPSAGEG